VRVRHYSYTIRLDSMTIKSTCGYSIWVEYSITPQYEENDIRDTILSLGRDADQIRVLLSLTSTFRSGRCYLILISEAYQTQK